jgi:ACR3 family arsenite transporter
VWLTLSVNWAIKPFTMYAIALLFLGFLFRGLIGAEATDLVKMPRSSSGWGMGRRGGSSCRT